MGDANRHPEVCGELEHNTVIMMGMTVHDAVRAVSPHRAGKILRVAEGIPGEEAADDLRSQRMDLGVVGTNRGRLYQEIEGKALTIEAAQHMHQPGFRAGVFHGINHLQDTDGLSGRHLHQ